MTWMTRMAVWSVILVSVGCAPKRYFGRGLILDVDRRARTVTVSHDRIAGYMEPMVMPLSVRDAALLHGIERGHRIHFRLAVEKNESYLDYLTVVSAEPVDPAKWQSPVLSRVVQTGETFPDFELTSQTGQLISLSRFRGKLVAVNFIYTRCPLPDYCPRMTNNFVSLHKRFGRKLGEELILLSITFDPQFDTPQVLGTYAKAFGADARGWYFLTGSKEAIARVCGFFGVEYWPDEGAITHNLQTGVIDREGRLAANVEGKDYTAGQLGDLVQQLLKR